MQALGRTGQRMIRRIAGGTRNSSHFASVGRLYAVGGGPWNLVLPAAGAGGELYNIENDPQEHQDRKAEKPAIAKRLSAKLSKWIAGLPAPASPQRHAK